jgi:hypothetical protein
VSLALSAAAHGAVVTNYVEAIDLIKVLMWLKFSTLRFYWSICCLFWFSGIEFKDLENYWRKSERQSGWGFMGNSRKSRCQRYRAFRWYFFILLLQSSFFLSLPLFLSPSLAF